MGAGDEEMMSSASSSADAAEVHVGVGAAAPSSNFSSSGPLTPADNFMISSSTGLGLDSVPATPVDIHGDNDLSVPSPAGMGVRPSQNRRVAAAAEADNVVDSTVDSTGMPLPRQMPGMEYDVRGRDLNLNALQTAIIGQSMLQTAEYCQSSRYLDSSDDDDDDDDLQKALSASRATRHLPSSAGLDGAGKRPQADARQSQQQQQQHLSSHQQQGGVYSSSSSSMAAGAVATDDSGISTSGQVPYIFLSTSFSFNNYAKHGIVDATKCDII